MALTCMNAKTDRPVLGSVTNRPRPEPAVGHQPEVLSSRRATPGRVFTDHMCVHRGH